jgi:hypothetical protein
MNQLDSVKLGLLCITILGVCISIAAIAWHVEKSYEICLAALAGVTVIGGWLGHAQPPSQTPGQDTGTTVKDGK